MEIPNLTETILQNIRPLESPDDFKRNDNYSVQTQDWCCEALMYQSAVPWLWDLDNELIRKKQQEGDWNWKLLVIKLMKLDIHRPHDTSLDLPVGLRNRRRIWRCLDEARIDDTYSTLSSVLLSL